MCVMHKAGWLIYQRFDFWQVGNNDLVRFYNTPPLIPTKIQMSDTSIKQQKLALRSDMRALLQSLTTKQRAVASANICLAVTTLVAAQPAISTIASFIALPSEPDLAQLHTNLPNHRIVYPHSFTGGKMHFHTVDNLNQLESGLYGIPQPSHNPSTLVDPSAIDLFLCPGFAFTETGQRLGKGGGYYDRLLSQRSNSSRLIGICFTEQVLLNLPNEEHDIRVEHIIHA